MDEPRRFFVTYLLDGAFRRMAVHEWGKAEAPPVVCVHGLARNGRDFDDLGRALAPRFRVLCPDLPGRGASEWLDNGAQYQPLSYLVALSHLLATLPPDVRWVGTSLGGICGMLLAASRQTPLSRLVLNDIGPFVPAAALARIAAYLTDPADFADLPALEAHLRRIYKGFALQDDAAWARMAAHSARPLANGRIALAYDPRIAEPMHNAPPQPIDLWAVWQAIRLPVLVLRGAESDVLSPETLARMEAEGARSLVVAGAGHAPSLQNPAEIATIRDFLS